MSENKQNNIHNECPSNEYSHGEPSGSCWGDGHYMCNNCKLFRNDFKGEGYIKRDNLLFGQGGIQIDIIK